ncbi:hypothetical protein F5148DRAFT_1160584 [Russula earlei]|uniref:Uncharacterized protein n=1 Tax=Russula earlei TaxID=71964 RepID=A0ACC0UNK6_9AGAM|nr:hypothetical protein F5148DRAFT_1160584 [Russula earlei]
MRISLVFTIICLAVGIAPSFAIPSHFPRATVPGKKKKEQLRKLTDPSKAEKYQRVLDFQNTQPLKTEFPDDGGTRLNWRVNREPWGSSPTPPPVSVPTRTGPVGKKKKKKLMEDLTDPSKAKTHPEEHVLDISQTARKAQPLKTEFPDDGGTRLAWRVDREPWGSSPTPPPGSVEGTRLDWRVNREPWGSSPTPPPGSVPGPSHQGLGHQEQLPTKPTFPEPGELLQPRYWTT